MSKAIKCWWCAGEGQKYGAQCIACHGRGKVRNEADPDHAYELEREQELLDQTAH
jgi:mono/diheme cytochrome c family protein